MHDVLGCASAAMGRESSARGERRPLHLGPPPVGGRRRRRRGVRGGGSPLQACKRAGRCGQTGGKCISCRLAAAPWLQPGVAFVVVRRRNSKPESGLATHSASLPSMATQTDCDPVCREQTGRLAGAQF